MNSENEQRLRDALQGGVLIVDSLLAHHRDLAEQAERWINDVAKLGSAAPVVRRNGTPGIVVEVEFFHDGQRWCVSLDEDGDVGLERAHTTWLDTGLAGTWTAGMIRGMSSLGDVVEVATRALRDATSDG